MDTREDRAEANGAGWLMAGALLATITFGFRDFPDHWGLIASAAILGHCVGDFALNGTRVNIQRREISARLDTLTLWSALLDLAERISDHRPPPAYEFDTETGFWAEHRQAALAHFEREMAYGMAGETLGAKSKPSLGISLVARVGFYIAVVLVAFGLSLL